MEENQICENCGLTADKHFIRFNKNGFSLDCFPSGKKKFVPKKNKIEMCCDNPECIAQHLRDKLTKKNENHNPEKSDEDIFREVEKYFDGYVPSTANKIREAIKRGYQKAIDLTREDERKKLKELKRLWREKCKRMDIMSGNVAIYEFENLLKNMEKKYD